MSLPTGAAGAAGSSFFSGSLVAVALFVAAGVLLPALFAGFPVVFVAVDLVVVVLAAGFVVVFVTGFFGGIVVFLRNKFQILK